MFGAELFEGSVVVLLKIVYLVSLLFVLSAGEFYKIGRIVDVIRITFNNAVGTRVKKMQEVFVNIINIRFKTTGVVNFSHYGKTFTEGVLNVVFPERREHHAHPFGGYAKEAEIIMNHFP